MGFKRLDSIWDYAGHRFDVNVACRSCGYAVVLDSTGVCRMLSGSDLRVAAISKRMRCSKCGMKNADVTPIDWVLSRAR